MYKAMYHTFDHQRLSDKQTQVENIAFLHDFNAVLESPHLKKLAKKTQLIPNSEHCHNRLSHTIDVCHVSGLIVEHLNHYFQENNITPINKDLVKAISLAHDIGHPPYGHTGERALDEMMKTMGGFESNAQSVKILVNSSDDFKSRTLTALMKYKTKIPLIREEYNGLIKGYYGYMTDYLEPLFLTYQENVIEQSIVDIADTLSYALSDLKDLIQFYGENRFAQLLNKYFTEGAMLEEAMLFFPEISKSELLYFIPKIMEDIKNNILGKILQNYRKYISEPLQSIIHDFIDTLVIKINYAQPMYSKLSLPIENELKLFLLNQITKKCFLERKVNREIDKKITHNIQLTYDYLFNLNSEDSLLKLDKEVLQQLINISNVIERSRFVCDVICHLSDMEIGNFVRKSNKKIIVV
ncbi:HD domain-containing protein [Gottfriedia sp. NPDC057948]|uniref:HD domain-containing protein n=1 Tax=Gottfriedia sp. NPDC057948 TaxID=3346287 RepID=UPI0036D9B8A8